MRQARTWKDVVSDALRQLDGEGTLKEIADIAVKDPKAETNTKVREKVRQVVRAYKIFETAKEGSGIYRLAPDKPLSGLDKVANTSAVTYEIQAKLLYIGRANNFETFAPSTDRTRGKYEGKQLKDFTTVRNLNSLERLKEIERKKIALIDVLWLTEEDGGDLHPRFAFEIEHSTKVLEGLNRLNVIPTLFQTKLFIVGKDERREKLFRTHLSSPTFKRYENRFGFKYFDEVRKLFTYAAKYQRARDANDEVMRSAGLNL